MTRVFLSLGSNLGDRMHYLRSAVDALGRVPSMELLGVSKVYETAPVEVGEEQPEYLNCVVEVECGLPALELLRYCQEIEAALGRVRKGEKAPRTVDVDVLLYGETAFETEELAVPHRGVTRAFNLKGLADIDPSVYIPGCGVVGELLEGVEMGGVRRFGEGL